MLILRLVHKMAFCCEMTIRKSGQTCGCPSQDLKWSAASVFTHPHRADRLAKNEFHRLQFVDLRRRIAGSDGTMFSAVIWRKALSCAMTETSLMT
jgi:hypothetical protein